MIGGHMTFDELMRLIAKKIEDGAMTLEDVKDALEMKERMEDDLK